MATANFTFGQVAVDMATFINAGAVTEDETISGSNAPTAAAATASQNVCRVAVDTTCWVSFGTAPDASTDTTRRYLMAANTVEYFQLKAGDKAACVAVS